jgi:RNA polymerase sigma-70 factor (ECF subfamily)
MNHALGSARDAGRANENRRGRGETAESTLARRQAQFQVFVARTRQRLYRFALHTLGNPQDAEDVTQEALTRAWTHFEAFDPQRSFEAWVFRIANNLMIDRNRRLRRRKEISLDGPAAGLSEYEGMWGPELSDSGSNPQNHLMAKEVSAELQFALRSLPPLHQATLLLVVQERSYEQIARTLDCPVGTVRSRVHRARAMLQRNLKARTSH